MTALSPDADPRVDEEQRHLDRVYGRLDRMRRTTQRRLSSTLSERGGTPQALSERESYERMYNEDLAKFDAAEHNLYFGRLDLEDGEIRRIGRIGVLDDGFADDGELDATATDATLLLDWRAPLARPFYLATPAAPEDVARRRHIRTRSRKVRGVSDESLTAGDALLDDFGHGNVVNESALVAALNAARTGEMTDIVETIQREQDLIIRSTHRGVTVIQGGPGTGKTAVALHRAAYLLYTHRENLSRSGILIIGPNDDFLNYIGQVLPSLGESGVLLSTIGDLFPGVRAGTADLRTTAAVKGGLRMVNVLKRAVRAQQSLPSRPEAVDFDSYTVEIDSALVKAARAKARATRRAHNLSQNAFLKAGLAELAARHAAAIGSSLLDGSQLLSPADIADIRDDMSRDPDIRAALLRYWPTLTPQALLRDLLGDERAIRKATPGWTDADRAALHRPSRPATTFGRGLLACRRPIAGRTRRADRLRHRGRGAGRTRTLASPVGRGAGRTGHPDRLGAAGPRRRTRSRDPDGLRPDRRRTARVPPDRDTTRHDGRTCLRRPHLDVRPRHRRRGPRALPHVLADGDATHPESVDDDHRRHRSDIRRGGHALVGRGPGAVCREALAVQRAVGQLPDPERDHGVRRARPRRDRQRREGPDLVAQQRDRAGGAAGGQRLPGSIADAVLRAVGLAEPDGLTAVVVPDHLHDPIDAALAPDRFTLPDREPPRVYTVRSCKGLEFDTTIVVEPAAIIDQSPRGLSDLYVALTRATQRLVVVHRGDLPDALADLPAG